MFSTKAKCFQEAYVLDYIIYLPFPTTYYTNLILDQIECDFPQKNKNNRISLQARVWYFYILGLHWGRMFFRNLI